MINQNLTSYRERATAALLRGDYKEYLLFSGEAETSEQKFVEFEEKIRREHELFMDKYFNKRELEKRL